MTGSAVYRFCFALLLLLSLWPPPAAASTGMHEGDTLAAVALDAEDSALRAVGGLESLSRLEGRSAERTWRPVVDRSSARGALLRTGLRQALLSSIVPDAEGCAPHCERLPYYPTAPPPPR